MADLRENAITLLSRNLAVDLRTAAPTTISLFTVPAGKTAIITHVVVHTPNGTLAGMTNDTDFGVAAAVSSWVQNVNLATGMDGTTKFFVIEATGAYVICAATEVFSIKITTGATADPATATIDVFGYLY